MSTVIMKMYAIVLEYRGFNFFLDHANHSLEHYSDEIYQTYFLWVKRRVLHALAFRVVLELS